MLYKQRQQRVIGATTTCCEIPLSGALKSHLVLLLSTTMVLLVTTQKVYQLVLSSGMIYQLDSFFISTATSYMLPKLHQKQFGIAARYYWPDLHISTLFFIFTKHFLQASFLFSFRAIIYLILLSLLQLHRVCFVKYNFYFRILLELLFHSWYTQ